MTMGNCLNFMAGVGCGVAVGFLVAPKSGAAMRNEIAGKVTEGQEAVTNTINGAVGDFKHAVQRHVAVADHTIKEGVAAFDDARDVFMKS